MGGPVGACACVRHACEPCRGGRIGACACIGHDLVPRRGGPCIGACACVGRTGSGGHAHALLAWTCAKCMNGVSAV
eukprot:365353-Chlamydomonas_euryale.AAC.14